MLRIDIGRHVPLVDPQLVSFGTLCEEACARAWPRLPWQVGPSEQGKFCQVRRGCLPLSTRVPGRLHQRAWVAPWWSSLLFRSPANVPYVP